MQRIGSALVALALALVGAALPPAAAALAPVATFNSFVEVNGRSYQHASGDTLYVNTTQSGAMAVRINAFDGDDGMDRVDFPPLGFGWFPGAGFDPTGSPYEYAYSFNPGAASPGRVNATAWDVAADSTNVSFVITADVAAPVDGSTTTSSSWLTTTSASVSFTPGSDPDSGIASWQLERRQALVIAGACGSFGEWNTIASMPASPYVDHAVAGGTCYDYRLRVNDNVDNSATFVAANTVRVDLDHPSGTIAATPVDPFRGTKTITGTGFDPMSGIGSVDVTYDGPSSGTICASPPSPAAWSCTWNTTMLMDGTYTIRLQATDSAGNVQPFAATRTVLVDNTVPIASLEGFTEGASPQFQHVAGTTMYLKSSSSGSFMVKVAATDPGSGIKRVDFPELGAGFGPGGSVPGAPYSYTYSWSASSASPGTVQAAAFDNAGSSTNVPFTIMLDGTAPSGVTISSTNLYASGASSTVTFTGGIDTGSGVAMRQLERRSATISGGTCGAYGDWSTIGPANPVSPYTDPGLSSNTCYQYRLQVTDNVGSVGTFTSPDTRMVDVTAPAGTIAASPSSPVRGAPTITGTSSDQATGVAGITLSYSGPVSGTVCASPPTPTAWSCSWNTAALPDGSYTLTLATRDVQGNTDTAAATRTVVVDNTAPTGSVTITGYSSYQHVTGSTIYVRVGVPPNMSVSFAVTIAANDDGSGVDQVSFPDLGAGWTPSGTSVSTPPYSVTYTADGYATTDPGATHATIRDKAGNTAEVDFTVLRDVTASEGGYTSYSGGFTNTPSALVTFGPGVDAGSGIDYWLLLQDAATLSGGSCAAFDWWGWVWRVSGNPASPATIGSLTDATCYRFATFVYDRVGNRAEIIGSDILKVDLTVPTGAIGSDPTGPVAGTVDLTGSASDAASGLAAVTLTHAGPASGTICTSPSNPASWTCPWDTTTVPDGTYTLQLALADRASNAEAAPITRTITVDNTGPTTSIAALTAGDGAAHQHAVGTQLFFNPAQSGSVTLAVDSTDAGTGMQRVDFPALGSGWTPAGGSDATGPSPWTFTYAWTAGAVSPGAQSVTAIDVAGRTTTASFTVTADSTSPTAGSVPLVAATTNAGAIAVPFAAGEDDQSGRASWRVERRTAPFAGGSCGAFGEFAQIGAASPASPLADAGAPEGCHQWRVVTVDHVGNTSASSPSETIRIDRTQPEASMPSLRRFTGGSRLTFTVSDAGSGAATWQLERSIAPFSYVTNRCRTFGAWTAVGSSNQTSPYVNARTRSGWCERVRLRVSDASGNVAVSGVRQSNGSRTIGSPGADTLPGTAARETIDGGAGNDRLTGGRGIDTLVGGSGNDTINARDGRAEAVRCGAGRDVAIVDRTDRVTACETVRRR